MSGSKPFKLKPAHTAGQIKSLYPVYLMTGAAYIFDLPNGEQLHMVLCAEKPADLHRFLKHVGELPKSYDPKHEYPVALLHQKAVNVLSNEL